MEIIGGGSGHRPRHRRGWRGGPGLSRALGAMLLIEAGSASAAAPSLQSGPDTGDHLSGNHALPGPGISGGGTTQQALRADAASRVPAGDRHPVGRDFVKRSGARLKLGKNEFRFAGTNTYYLPYSSEFMVDDALTRAADQGFTVVRTWAFADIGNRDGSNSVNGGKVNGVVYYQYFDGTKPAYNDGPDGLQHLDYVIKRAGELGLHLVVALTNDWTAFGGMDQYVRWANGQFHDQFYTSPKIRRWFKDWISHVLLHQNAYTGVAYKDDPTIMTFELANEPRCIGSGLYPASPSCTAPTLTSWANEMSTFIKGVDRNHLVSVGDEGFYCDPQATDWLDQCGEGVDTLALTALPNVDVMSLHLYPDAWLHDAAWGTEWINRHFADARALGKPAMLGEFGLVDVSTRNPVYKEWTDTTFAVGGAGALYWMLAGLQDDGTLYPDFDGLTVYCPGNVCTMLGNFSARMTANKALPFAPVADDDRAETVAVTPVRVAVLANDVTYNGARLAPKSVDLDPTVAGRQTTFTTPGGTFKANLDGTVTFVAAVHFLGSAIARYVVSDSKGALSTSAAVMVEVNPDPSLTTHLSSFESGTAGWLGANAPGDGVVAQSAAFASDGSFSLEVTPAHDDWFGADLAGVVDLSGKMRVRWEVRTTGSGTSQALAISSGTQRIWCQSASFEWVGPNTTRTIEVDLASLTCVGGVADLHQVEAVHIYLGNGGTDPIYIDNVRAE